MNDNKAAVFEGHQFLNLETFRKSGEAVQTPVWFVKTLLADCLIESKKQKW